MTLLLSEADVSGLLNMREVVGAVEETFKQQAASRSLNSPRTRSAVPGSSLNVMHASLPYLGRAGVKCYQSSKKGTKFLFVLFDTGDGSPLAVMGANVLGRNRTGATSAVATKYLFPAKEVVLGLCGSGWQALTQVLALQEVTSVNEVRVWSPTPKHREAFALELSGRGIRSKPSGSPSEALRGADVGSTITSSESGFIGAEAVDDVKHLNACGSNSTERAEVLPSAIAKFETIVVDDLAQARYEAGDLLMAEKAGSFTWEKALELKDFVSGKAKPEGKTFFKSHGAAIEDVAVASLVYEKAVKAGGYMSVELTLTP